MLSAELAQTGLVALQALWFLSLLFAVALLFHWVERGGQWGPYFEIEVMRDRQHPLRQAFIRMQLVWFVVIVTGLLLFAEAPPALQ